MPNTLWQSTVTSVGGESGEMLDGGVLILFGEPVPPALADMSVVHKGATELARTVQAGDTFTMSGNTYTVDEIGERACGNLTELGHVVIYANMPHQNLLPGAIKASGPGWVAPEVGSTIAFAGA
ncbi:MAG: PTS glucitol/sorbitol transporter subunit IIA [Propioniciclava sp.]